MRCGLAQGFSQDPKWRTLARPSTYSALGSAVHRLCERALRGRLLDSTAQDLDAAVSAQWASLVEEAYSELAKAWKPANVPSPASWPNFQLVSIRARRRAASLAAASHNDAPAPAAVGSGARSVEQELTDPPTGLRGTPDWVQESGGAIRVLDFKTGLNQADASEDQRRQLLLYAHLVRVKTKRLPDVCALVDGAGREHLVEVDDAAVDEALASAVAAVDDYNRHVLHGDLPHLARPSQEACRWCPFRPACSPYFESRQPDWVGAKGDVHGRVTDVAADGHAMTLLATYPLGLAGSDVRVKGLQDGTHAMTGQACSVVDADLLGGPTAQSLRWDSRLVLLVP
jgi:RecB family exonuclease